MLNVFLTSLWLLAGFGIGYVVGGFPGAIVGFVIALALRFGGAISDCGDSCCGFGDD